MPDEKSAPTQTNPQSLDDYLEIMVKVVFQSGMSWKVVENKMPGIKEAFKNFDIVAVADFDERDIEELVQDTRVIRNQRKLEAIVSNAGRMIDLDKEHDSFQNYLRAHGDFDATLKVIRNDFKFMGPFGVFYFLYVAGETVPEHQEFQKQYGK
jgi:3-methyladenine DNA glycosylase Tag